MKLVDVKSSAYVEFNDEKSDQDSKFKLGNHVRISKYKKFFTKGYTPDWSKEFFVIKLEILLRGHKTRKLRRNFWDVCK